MLASAHTEPDSSTPEDLTLDSTYLVAFDMTHRALKSGLKAASPLNITQYRILVKLLLNEPDGLSQRLLGQQLSLKANVITQAVDVLEQHHFALRLRGSSGRVHTVRATEEGENHVSVVNASIVEQLYTLFPTQDAHNRAILEASILAGASLDSPATPDVEGLYPATRALVSLELVQQATEEALLETCGAPINECRVLQRLGEVGEPLRISDIARQLQMSAVSVARAVNKLVERGWAQRLASPLDRKAVFVDATKSGKVMQDVIDTTLNDLAQRTLWSHLNPQQQRAIAQTWHVVIANIQSRAETERKAALSLLKPIS